MIRHLTFIFSLGIVLGVGLKLQAADMTDTSAIPADNSRTNQDNSSSTPTADQAKNSKTDVQIMAEIRRAIIKDKALSVYAHNVKVIAQNGDVHLAGVVHTQEEKDAIASKALAVAGEGHVMNAITVKGS